MKKAVAILLVIFTIFLSSCSLLNKHNEAASTAKQPETTPYILPTSAIAQTLVPETPEPTASPAPTATPRPTPIVSDDSDLYSVIDAILLNPLVLYEGNGNDIHTGNLRQIIKEDENTYIKIKSYNPEDGFSAGIGSIISSYEGWKNEIGAQHCIAVKFRSNSNIDFGFTMYALNPIVFFDFDMNPPEYPSVGIFNENMQYVGFNYPNEFDFVLGEWYYVLIAVNKDSDIAFAVWEEKNPENMAYFRANIEKDYQNSDYKSRGEWGLDLFSINLKENADFDIAGFYIIDFDGFIYEQ